MIEPAHDLPVARQAKILNLSRSSVYYRARPVSPEDLGLMRRIDELHLERPFAGSRMLRDFLEREGVAVGRRHVATLMRRMGVEAIYRRRNSSKPAPGHKIYPYLLRGVKVERPNQVWATDITYIPMARGFVYLVAVVDWFTRRVHRGAGGGYRQTWQTGNFQLRPGQSIHRRGVHRRLARERDRHQHGRQGLLARQCFRRAALEIC